MVRRNEKSPGRTFADHGIPFPLFEAPIKQTPDYAGRAACQLCREADRHCFKVDCLIAACPACGVVDGLITYGKVIATCRACGSNVPFPGALEDKPPMLACYQCLRAGKAAMHKATEFGLVDVDEAFEGITGAEPAPPTDQFELIADDREIGEPWYRARIPGEHLWELLRTPTMNTWQGEVWLFCCRKPMTYLGGYEAVLGRVRPDDPIAFVEGLLESEGEAANGIGRWIAAGDVILYLYRCKVCGRDRANCDNS